MIRLRNLKVWFPLRRGLARELTGRESLWVRAVDGVSLDVRRAEVFCLVGESGCGKTTTGKAILGLEDATDGDIFFEMPEAEYQEWERNRSDPSPAAAAKVNSLRRKYSFSWEETMKWTALHILFTAGMIAAGFLLAVAAPLGLLRFLGDPFGNAGLTLGLVALSAGILGLVGSLPPSRPNRRTPLVLALLSIAGVNLFPALGELLYGTTLAGGPYDAFGALGALWSEAGFFMLIGIFLAPAIAGGISKVLIGVRQERQGLKGIKMQTLRRRLHLIFQDPYESLNPKQSIFEIVAEPLQVNHVATSADEVAALVATALEDAGLRPAEEFMFRFPHELSGGQRQRVSIAAALALQPDFVVADEPVSMLDVSIRTEILQLMMDLRKKRGLTYLFITHDLSLAWVLADRIAVMYLGKIVEQGTTEQVIASPKHPYTQALISVVPSPDPRHTAQRTILRGERPDPVDIPTGCRFHPRCPMAFAKCGWNASELKAELETLLPAALPGRTGMLIVQDPHVLRIPVAAGSASEAADAFQALIKQNRDTTLVLRGIASVVPRSGEILVTMQPWAEPELVQVAPENLVACYLATPSSEAEPPVAALS